MMMAKANTPKKSLNKLIEIRTPNNNNKKARSKAGISCSIPILVTITTGGRPR